MSTLVLARMTCLYLMCHPLILVLYSNSRHLHHGTKETTHGERRIVPRNPAPSNSGTPVPVQARRQNCSENGVRIPIAALTPFRYAFLFSMGLAPPDVALSRMTFQPSPSRRRSHLSAKTMLTRTRFNNGRQVSLLICCRLRRSRHTAQGLAIILRMHPRSLQGSSTSCRSPSLGIGTAHPHTTPTPFL